MTNQSRSSRHGGASKPDIIGCLTLVALTWWLFLPAAEYGFVNWDDPWYVVNNSLINSWRPANLWHIATQPAVRNYAPLTMFGYLVQHSLWGMWAGGYHLANVALHAINAVLVYVLLKRLSGSRLIGAISAALFAVHPVQVETVAWISSFKGLLSGAFILASLICWMRPNPSPRHEGFGMLFHLLGLLSKALGITVPAIVFTYDVLVGKKRPADAISRQVVPCVLGLLVLLVNMSAQTIEVGGVRSHLGWGKARVMALDTVIVWDYVGMLLWPRDLCVMYDPPTAGISGPIALATFAWIGIAVAAYAARRKLPLLAVALVAFFALLFPVLNFFPITTLMNDRYLYLPSIAVFALMALAIAKIGELGRAKLHAADRLPAHRVRPDAARSRAARTWASRPADWQVAAVLTRSLALAGCCVLLLGYAVATRGRLAVWSSDWALWEDAIQKSPGLAVVRIQWATALYNSRKEAQAVAVLEATLAEAHPDDSDRDRIRQTLNDWKRSRSLN